MLGISRTSHYSSVLLELNLIPVNSIIDQLKISFVNSLINGKGSGICLETILEEESKFPGTGMIGEVKKLCKMYKLPDVTNTPITKEVIKEKVWKVAREELWINSMRNRRVPYTSKIKKAEKQYWGFPKHQAKILLSYYTGELTFKDSKRHEMTKKFGNTKCFTGCDEPDSFEHVKVCPNYDTKPENFNLDGTDRQFIKYLTELDMERWRKYLCPLVYRLDRNQRKERTKMK